MSQVKKNLFFNIISLTVNVLVGFFYTPYLVDNLGVLAYGVIPLSMIVSQYISILTTSLTGALTRFYIVEIDEKRYDKASAYLSGALIVLLTIIIMTLPMLWLLMYKIESLFNIPNKFLESAKILFLFTFLSFYSSLISSFFSIILYAKNRLDLMNRINIFRLVSKVSLNVVLFEFLFVDLKFIGIGNFVSEILILFYSYLLFLQNKDPNVKISFKVVQKFVFASLLGMTIWVVIHQIGDIALYKTDVFFVNKFGGTEMSGILGAISDFGSYVMVIIGVVSSLFGPLILLAYSNRNHQKVKDLTLNTSLIVGLITAVLCALLIGHSYSFLNLWLGPEIANFNQWFNIKLMILPFYAASGVFAFVYRAWNRVKFPALITLGMGGVSLVISYLICLKSNQLSLGIYYMLIFNAVMTFLQTYILGSFMVKSIYNEVSSIKLFFIFIKILLLMVAIICVCVLVNEFFLIVNWIQLVISCSVIGLLSLVIVYLVILDKSQRNYLLNIIQNK